MSRVRRNPESPDSVRARLAIIATERRAEFQTVLAEFAAERFLYRLGISSHAGRSLTKNYTGVQYLAIGPTPDIPLSSDSSILARRATAGRPACRL